jgi:hypothetical protein
MVALDLSGDTILKPCTTTFEQAWGLPCPHLVQRLMRERQPLEIEDFDIHWQLDRDVVLTLNWSDITQPPERVRRRGRQERDTRPLPSEFERVDYALHRLPAGLPGLVNSHILLLPANHIRPVEDHNEPGDGVEDGVGECQEEDYSQESLFYNSEDIRGPY